MFIATLFTIEKYSKQPMCLSMGDGVENLVYKWLIFCLKKEKKCPVVCYHIMLQSVILVQ